MAQGDYMTLKEQNEEYDYADYQYDVDNPALEPGEEFEEDYVDVRRTKGNKFLSVLFGGLDPQIVHSNRTILLAFVAVWLTAFCFMRYRQKMGKARLSDGADTTSTGGEKVNLSEIPQDTPIQKQLDKHNAVKQRTFPPKETHPDPVEEILKTLSISDSSMGFPKSSLM